MKFFFSEQRMRAMRFDPSAFTKKLNRFKALAEKTNRQDIAAGVADGFEFIARIKQAIKLKLPDAAAHFMFQLCDELDDLARYGIRVPAHNKMAPLATAGVAYKLSRSTGGLSRKAKLDEPDGIIFKRRSEVARLWKLQKPRTPEPDRIKQIAMQIIEKYGSQKGNSTQTIRTDLRALHLISPIARK